ncbi:MAG: serine/threonine-protein kinase [Acidobacteriota bacterium]
MTDLSGRTLGRYRLESVLGRGGMADVWRAVDVKLARTVAVKVIHASYAEDPHFAERFLREARVVASLEHPNILPVYDFGEEDGMPFLVMPHLAGGTLRERLRGAPAPPGLAAAWIGQLADALDAAHAAGVLHRDVKPANVLLGKDDRVFLADFGIAKMAETATGLTATGIVVGTPLYMAPEQAQGRPASPATDRYALAVVAYEILAGRPPFEGDNPLSLMHQHVSNPAPALSSRVGGLPAGLDAVLAAALSKDPAYRPPTCRAFADAVAAFLPTGAMPAAGAAARGRAPAATTAPTVIRTTAARRPPSLTSDATALTPVRRSRRGLAWGAAAGAVALAGLALVWNGRWIGENPAAAPPTPVPALVPTPVPTLVPTLVPTAAPTAPPPRPAAAAPLAGHSLAEARERLDVAKRPDRRLSKEDFRFVLEAARGVAAGQPDNADARALATYAEGGLAYVAGIDEAARALAAEAALAFRSAGRQDHRALQQLVVRPDGAVVPPRGWELAVVYGDARGEAMGLLDAAVRENPRDRRAQKARAMFRRLHRLEPDGPEPRRPLKRSP